MLKTVPVRRLPERPVRPMQIRAQQVAMPIPCLTLTLHHKNLPTAKLAVLSLTIELRKFRHTAQQCFYASTAREHYHEHPVRTICCLNCACRVATLQLSRMAQIYPCREGIGQPAAHQPTGCGPGTQLTARPISDTAASARFPPPS
jgi:hypothetical protein